MHFVNFWDTIRIHNDLYDMNCGDPNDDMTQHLCVEIEGYVNNNINKRIVCTCQKKKQSVVMSNLSAFPGLFFITF